jgi:hypothetical protein
VGLQPSVVGSAKTLGLVAAGAQQEKEEPSLEESLRTRTTVGTANYTRKGCDFNLKGCAFNLKGCDFNLNIRERGVIST